MSAMRIPEAARELGFSRWTLYKLIRSGELGCVRRPGGHIRIWPEHIEAFKRRHECPPTSSAAPTAALGTSDLPSKGERATFQLIATGGRTLNDG